jgi:hypothetical protein
MAGEGRLRRSIENIERLKPLLLRARPTGVVLMRVQHQAKMTPRRHSQSHSLRNKRMFRVLFLAMIVERSSRYPGINISIQRRREQ